ncbi:hypothetical protein INH39_27555 [Massilia violaceinigra]|uniref:Uncharacterized protein n=1 Tax=Massilia violaceinigra TaxID=2045208 RepID=A0ABY4A2Z5_9BURK|nr:hypothetical protein [Massilia violaceinigra]UOD29134.1 hypothetical protein INH39_27555 [Massilia violaceinigra]
MSQPHKPQNPQKPHKTYNFEIHFESGVFRATFTTNIPQLPDGTYVLDTDDEIQFVFGNGDIEVRKAVLLSAKKYHPETGSPFQGAHGDRVELVNNKRLSVDELGTWCFFISFYAMNNKQKWEFHLLPDPELQVGSIPHEQHDS